MKEPVEKPSKEQVGKLTKKTVEKPAKVQVMKLTKNTVEELGKDNTRTLEMEPVEKRAEDWATTRKLLRRRTEQPIKKNTRKSDVNHRSPVSSIEVGNWS